MLLDCGQTLRIMCVFTSIFAGVGAKCLIPREFQSPKRWWERYDRERDTPWVITYHANMIGATLPDFPDLHNTTSIFPYRYKCVDSMGNLSSLHYVLELRGVTECVESRHYGNVILNRERFPESPVTASQCGRRIIHELKARVLVQYPFNFSKTVCPFKSGMYQVVYSENNVKRDQCVGDQTSRMAVIGNQINLHTCLEGRTDHEHPYSMRMHCVGNIPGSGIDNADIGDVLILSYIDNRGRTRFYCARYKEIEETIYMSLNVGNKFETFCSEDSDADYRSFGAYTNSLYRSFSFKGTTNQGGKDIKPGPIGIKMISIGTRTMTQQATPVTYSTGIASFRRKGCSSSGTPEDCSAMFCDNKPGSCQLFYGIWKCTCRAANGRLTRESYWLTFQGKMMVNKTLFRLRPGRNSMLNLEVFLRQLQEQSTFRFDEKIFSPIVHVNKVRIDQETRVDFALYYKTPKFKGIRIRSSRRIFLVDKIKTELEPNVYEELNNRLEALSEWAGVHIVLRSTVACPKAHMAGPDGEPVTWRKTVIGHRGRTEDVCFLDSEPLGQAECSGNVTTGARWDNIAWHGQCFAISGSRATQKLKYLVERKTNANNVAVTAQDVAALTANVTSITIPDIIYTSKLLEDIAKVPESNATVGNAFMQIVNQMLMVNRTNLHLAQLQNNASHRILKSLESFTQNMDLGNHTHLRFTQPMVAVEVWDVLNITSPVFGFGIISNDTSPGFHKHSPKTFNKLNDDDYKQTEAMILLPKSAIQKALKHTRGNDQHGHHHKALGNTRHRLLFVTYANTKLFYCPPQKNNLSREQTFINSRIVSASFGDIKLQNLPEPILTSFLPLKNESGRNPVCVYWEFSANNGSGGWNSKGGTNAGMKTGRVVCQWNHLTNFAILVNWHPGVEIQAQHKLPLTVISIIGVSLSIVGLSFTIISFVIFRKLRVSRSQKVLFNLAVALLATNVLFLVGIARTDSDVACMVVAALLYYFLMAAFMWMLVEALVQYLKFVKVFKTRIHLFMLKVGIPAWGIPALALIAIARVDYTQFRGHMNYCWLAQDAFHYAFMMPVGLIVLINTIVFILVIKGITCDRLKVMKGRQDSDISCLQLQAGLMIFILLGLTWIFGFFAIDDARIPFQYVFCIFNGLQGFFIFIMCMLREQTVRDSWKQLICRKTTTHRKFSAPDTFSSDTITGNRMNLKDTRSKSANINRTSCS